MAKWGTSSSTTRVFGFSWLAAQRSDSRSKVPLRVRSPWKDHDEFELRLSNPASSALHTRIRDQFSPMITFMVAQLLLIRMNSWFLTLSECSCYCCQ